MENVFMEKKLSLILHDIRSAYNVGAIFRSADGAGVSKIFLSGYTPCPRCDEDVEKVQTKKDKLEKTRAEKMLDKTALGAEKSVLWEKVENLDILLERLVKEGQTLVALEKTDNSIEIKNFQSNFPMTLIVGNEVEGVSAEVLKKCDAVISLPMRGQKESLNVSVAAGIAMYELLS